MKKSDDEKRVDNEGARGTKPGGDAWIWGNTILSSPYIDNMAGIILVFF